MFPTKNTFDFMAEYQRIWPKVEGNADSMQFNQSPHRPVNRSSSSTDSTSPESYFDNPFIPSEFNFRTQPRRIFSPSYENQYDTPEPRSLFDTPFTRHRPILGRKILPDNSPNEEQLWQIPEPSRNYELFPEKSFEHTPPQNSTPINNFLNSPPPLQTSVYQAPKVSPIMNPINFERPASSVGVGESKICTFCKKNGERPKVYMTHWVKEKVGNKFVVTCPVLRSHVCSECGESGDNAHTITYCPVLRTTNNGKPLQSTTITLKNTRVLSNGRKRY